MTRRRYKPNIISQNLTIIYIFMHIFLIKFNSIFYQMLLCFINTLFSGEGETRNLLALYRTSLIK